MKAISLHQPWASLLVTRQPWEGEHCQVCGAPYATDYWLDDDVWAKITPKPDIPGAGLLCPACATTRAAGHGITLTIPIDETSLAMIKRFETRSWPCPPALIGQPIAFHATQQKPPSGTIGSFGVTNPNRGPLLWSGPGTSVPLPLGAIVGSGRITASLPIVHWSDNDEEGPSCVSVGHNDGRIYSNIGWSHHDVTDQLPYGDFTLGRYAWLIEDAAPTTERCPWCWGARYVKGFAVDGVMGGMRPSDVRCPVCDGAGRCDPIPAKGHQRIWNWESTA